jgi:hypothetical protein
MRARQHGALNRCTNDLGGLQKMRVIEVGVAGGWPSPIAVRRAMLRRLAPKLEGPDAVVRYRNGLLFLNSTGVDAREI